MPNDTRLLLGNMGKVKLSCFDNVGRFALGRILKICIVGSCGSNRQKNKSQKRGGEAGQTQGSVRNGG